MCTYLTIKTCMYISYVSLILSNQKLYLLVAPGRKTSPSFVQGRKIPNGREQRGGGKVGSFWLNNLWREYERCCTFGHMLIDVAGVLPFIDLLEVLFRISEEGQQHFANTRFLNVLRIPRSFVDRIQPWNPVFPTRTYLDNCWRQTDEPLHTPREKHPGCRGFCLSHTDAPGVQKEYFGKLKQPQGDLCIRIFLQSLMNSFATNLYDIRCHFSGFPLRHVFAQSSIFPANRKSPRNSGWLVYLWWRKKKPKTCFFCYWQLQVIYWWSGWRGHTRSGAKWRASWLRRVKRFCEIHLPNRMCLCNFTET